MLSQVRAAGPKRALALLLHPPLLIADGWTVTQERRGRGGEEATAPPAAAKNI